MGKLSKSRGKAYEYRVAKWFTQRPGWEDSFRIPLSGASERITNEIAGHDVLAQCAQSQIKIACECKKTGGDVLRIEHVWLEKLDYPTHEMDKLLVFAFGRSTHYVMIPAKQFFKLTGVVAACDGPFVAKGERFFTLHHTNLRQVLDTCKYAVLLWLSYCEEYCFATLENYVKWREKLCS